MLFNSYPFAIFFLFLFPVYWLAPKPARSGILIGASLLFYSMWIPQYLVLLIFELAVNYLLLLGILKTARPKLYLTLSIVFSLTLLAYFKYVAFLITAFAPFLEWGLPFPVEIPDVLLPLGISFYTFQLLGLAIDGYRQPGAAVKSFSEYVLFVAFFPQLIAGPILRGKEIIPQFRVGGVLTLERVQRASWLITAGLAKKTIFADALLAPYVNQVFSAPGFSTAPEHLIAMYSFAFQIYFDFSGYTDMARGLGLLLGFEIPLNFREPYLSRNPSEFWRRWHITLSRWLRDYLYIPLGGNRSRPMRVYINLTITMLLGGLWHGAGWNFLIWGGLHGVLLAVHRFATRGRHAAERPAAVSDLPAMILMFHATCLLWVFFRAGSFDDAMSFLSRMVLGPYDVRWPVLQCLIVITCGALHPIERLCRANAGRMRALTENRGIAFAESFAIGVVLGVVGLLGGFGGAFIYFQF